MSQSLTGAKYRNAFRSTIVMDRFQADQCITDGELCDQIVTHSIPFRMISHNELHERPT